MEHPDAWGQDPAIRRMRLVFAAMEEGQRSLLQRTGLSLFDPRLRSWRKRALALFERAWAQEARAGRESGIDELYARVLAEVLAADGVQVSGGSSSRSGDPR